jgi:Hsp70 protein
MLRCVSAFLVAVDHGTVNTVAVLRGPDGQRQPVLFDGSPLVPSAAAVGPDDRLLVGRDAESVGRSDPAAFVPDPRSRIDAGTVTVGQLSVPVADVIGATVAMACREAARGTGGAPLRLVLTHPATWDEDRRSTLTEAGLHAGLGVPTLVPVPVAAAWYHAESVGHLAPGQALLVYHLGAATFEVSLLRRTATGYRVIATDGLGDLGGLDLDELLLRLVGSALPAGSVPAWQRLVAPGTEAELHAFTRLCDNVRAAKEALSRQLAVRVAVPSLDRDVEIRRETFESAAEPVLARTADLAAELLARAGTAADEVAALVLVGGSSRIPLVTTLLRRRLGLTPVVCRHPELAAAEGALIAAAGATRRPAFVDEPTRELAPVLRAAATAPPVPVPVPDAVPVGRRRPNRLLAAAAALVCVALPIGWYVAHPSGYHATGRGSAEVLASSAGTGPQTGTGASAGGTKVRNGPVPSGSPSLPAGASPSVPVPSASPSAGATSATPAVVIALTAAPASGTCDTNFTFVAHFVVGVPGRYHWHWVFGGPDGYSAASGDQSLDRTGDAHIGRKFGNGPSGTYWAQVQVTAPVAVTSDPVTVEVTCSK